MSFSACDFLHDDAAPEMVEVTFEAARDAGYNYSDVQLNGTNLGDSFPIETVTEKGIHTVTWTYHYSGLQDPKTHTGSIEVEEEGQVFIFDQDTIH